MPNATGVAAELASRLSAKSALLSIEPTNKPLIKAIAASI
jgi:hypothetical protein